MLGNKPPYTTMQQLNLDWILSKLKTLLRLVPDDGAVGQILRRTRDGAVWSDEQGGGGGGSVESVNGQTGAVVLDAADVGALPDDYTPPVTSVNGQTGAVVIPTGGAVDSVNGQTGTVVLDADDVGALPDDYTPPVTSVNGQTGAVVIPTGGNVDSVNGKTGTVVLDAADVGALPDDYTPPVTSVNGQTGAVVLPSIKLVTIPQTLFTWNAATSSFICTDLYNKVPEIVSQPNGFFGYFTGGVAIFSAVMRGTTLHICGWIPSISQSIGSSYTDFVCTAVIKE